MSAFNRFHKTPRPAGLMALGRLPSGQMNKTEAAYAQELELQRQLGIVAWWAFEGLKYRLADNTFYTPDFAVMLKDGTLQAHEVKGFWEEDARAKIKIAAALFPIQFIAIKKSKLGWEREAF
jgi:hypothetical protein